LGVGSPGRMTVPVTSAVRKKNCGLYFLKKGVWRLPTNSRHHEHNTLESTHEFVINTRPQTHDHPVVADKSVS